MKRFYVFKDGKSEESTATRERAIDMIRQYQKLETHHPTGGVQNRLVFCITDQFFLMIYCWD